MKTILTEHLGEFGPPDLYEKIFDNNDLIPHKDVLPETVPFAYGPFGKMTRGNNGQQTGMPLDDPKPDGRTVFVNRKLSADASETIYLVPPGRTTNSARVTGQAWTL